MIIGLIIFGLLLFSIAYGLVYVVSYLPTLWTVRTEKLKRVRRLVSAISGLLITSFYLFVSPTSNNETAIIESYGDKYLVTFTGERLLMAHDPISFLKRETYTDTLQLIIPRDKGKINGAEIPTEKGHYKMIGTLNIDEEQMKLDLYYDNSDDNIQDPLSWNDNYKIKTK
jgi:hypothetical protein